MRIRNSGTLHPQQQRSVSPPHDVLSSVLQPSPSPLPCNKPTFCFTEAIMSGPLSSDPHQAAPEVMVSRTNAKLSSVAKDTIFDAGSPFAQDDSTTDNSWSSMSTNESFGHGTCFQTSTSSSVSSSLSYNGRWCEEERAIPLKKRRVVMVSDETGQSKEMKEEEKKDAVEIRKGEMGEMEDYKRCNRRGGKGWRCNKMRVGGLVQVPFGKAKDEENQLPQQQKPNQEKQGSQGSIH